MDGAGEPRGGGEGLMNREAGSVAFTQRIFGTGPGDTARVRIVGGVFGLGTVRLQP